jgi:hypothetical protein
VADDDDDDDAPQVPDQVRCLTTRVSLDDEDDDDVDWTKPTGCAEKTRGGGTR